MGAATALAILSLQPREAAAQGERPSVRISGGHVFIGGRHVGSIGSGRDPHALGHLIRGRLSEMGDPRAVRFGPGRLGNRSLVTRYPWWIHPRTAPGGRFHPGAFPPHRARPWPAHPGSGWFWHPGSGWFWHAGHAGPWFPAPGLVVGLYHPFGAVLIAHRVGWWRWTQATHVHVGATVQEAPRAGARQERPGAPDPAPRPRPAPYEPPPERCADVAVWMLAGAVQRIRVDLATLEVESPEEAEDRLERQLRMERRLDLRGSRGDGIVVPASLVRGLEVAWCEPPSGSGGP